MSFNFRQFRVQLADARARIAVEEADTTAKATKVTTDEIENTGDTITIDCIKADGDSTIAIGNSADTYFANVTVDGAVTVTGAVSGASADFAGQVEAGGFLTDAGLVAASAAIPVTKSAAYEIVTAGAETNTLAAPTYCGQEISLYCRDRQVGDRVVTVTGATVNQTGNNTITFGATGDWILLKSIDVNGTLTWRVLANDGAALSTA